MGSAAVATPQRGLDPRESLIAGAVARVTSDAPRIKAELCRRSFYTFVQEFWDTVVKDDLVLNWHMAVLCREIQTILERVSQGKPKLYDFVANVPPGTSKSTIVVQMAPAWAWSKWDWMRFLCGSYSGELATEHGGLCKDIVTSEKYREMFPHVKIRPDQDAKSNFKLTGGGQRIACSVGGTATGKHAHVILVDDPLNPKQAVSEAMTASANHWMNHTLSTRKVDKKLTPTILIMQRLHQNDCTGDWMVQREQGRSIKHLSLPADIAPRANGKRAKAVPKEMERFYSSDGLLDPARMPRAVLEEAEIALGQYGYAGQFQQDPAPPSGGMFQVDVLESRIVDIPQFKIERTVRYWDKAGSHEEGAYTVGLQMALLSNGDVLVLDVVRGQWLADKRNEIMRETAEADGVKTKIYVEQEPGSGGKESAHFSVKDLAGFPVYIDHPTGDKAYRADPFSAQVNAGHVWLMRAPWNKAYIEELRLFPKGTYKDQVDASSGAYNLLIGNAKRAGALRSRTPGVGR